MEGPDTQAPPAVTGTPRPRTPEAPPTGAGHPTDASARAAAAGLDVHICRDPGEFAALAPQWARLHRACPRATPFQSHAWLYSWWLWYGRPGRLRIVLVRRGGDPAGEGAEPGGQGELVGAFALMRTYRPLPALVPLGGAVTDFSDALVDPGAGGDTVAAALVRGMRRAARGSLIDLREVPPGGAAGRLYDLWPGPKQVLADSECLELPGGPMSELIARVGSSRGQRIRSNLRKIDAAGIQEHDVPAADVPGAVATMLRLHAAQWEGRGVTPEHLRPRFAAHLSHACALMTESGEALLTEFRLHGAVVAVNLTVLSPTLAGGYLYGADLPALSAAKVDLNTLLTRHGARLTSAAARPVHSMLRGAEPHKSHWRPVPTSNTRLLLSTRRSLPSLLTRRALAALREVLRELRRRRRSRDAPAGKTAPTGKAAPGGKAAPATRPPHRPPDGSSRSGG